MNLVSPDFPKDPADFPEVQLARAEQAAFRFAREGAGERRPLLKTSEQVRAEAESQFAEMQARLRDAVVNESLKRARQVRLLSRVKERKSSGRVYPLGD